MYIKEMYANAKRHFYLIFIMFLLVIILLWCAVFAIWWSVKPRYPSPPVFPGALPIIGHAIQMLVGPLEMWKKEQEVYHYCLENGGIIQIRFGPHPVYLISDLEDCLTVANTCMDKPYVYNFGKVLYNRGLVTADATIWKPHRKLLNPAFNQQILNTFVQEHTAQAKRLVSELAPEVGKGPFDVVPYLLNTVLRSVYKTTIGVKSNDCEQEVTLKTYATFTDKFFVLLESRFQTVWLHLPVIFNMSSMKKKQNEVVKTLKNITERIISNRKSERKLNVYEDSMKDTKPGYKSLLDQLLEAGEKQETFTDEEIREHLDTIIGAAYDSSTRAMTFCLVLVGSHPDVQARIFNELQEVLDDPDRDITKLDLPKLVYLDAVLRETLRLYPPVPRIGKCSQSAVKLKNYTLPAGSTIAIPLYAINRHPVWGADANEFKPERWLDPATLPDNPNAFATFSIGKRNCLGKQYSMMAMKTTLAYIFRRYHITGDIRDVQCRCDLILKPVIGHQISIELRQ